MQKIRLLLFLFSFLHGTVEKAFLLLFADQAKALSLSLF